MSKQPLKVLSIDFDFFQRVSPETIIYQYPDGHDLNTEMSIFIWGHHYATEHSAKILKTVKVNRIALNSIKSVIKNNNNYDDIHRKSMIVNSHRHIYDFIKDNFDSDQHSCIDVYNVDMHHDMFDSTVVSNIDGTVEYKTGPLDCANWATCVKRDFPGSIIHWICNPISQELYSSPFPDDIIKDINYIKSMKFDLIFLCRSDIYVPPHLDKAFDELRKCIQSNFTSTLIEESIQTPRDMTEYVNALKNTFKRIQLDKEKSTR